MSAYSLDDFIRDTGVSRETAERLETHRTLLAAWSRRINLVGPGELQDYWRRHALDSQQLIALAPGARRWLDLGSGAGFPGLVIALCLAEGHVDLVESNPKKAAFLREAVRATGAKARVLETKVEALADAGDGAGAYDVATARAFAPLNRLIASARPWLDQGALGLFPKGADHGAELVAAGFPPQGGAAGGLTAMVSVSVSDPRGRILAIRRALDSKDGSRA